MLFSKTLDAYFEADVVEKSRESSFSMTFFTIGCVALLSSFDDKTGATLSIKMKARR